MIGIVRYIAVCKPLYVRTICTRQTVTAITIITIACDLVIHIPFYDKKVFPSKNDYFKIFYLGLFYDLAIHSAVPLVVLLYMSFRLRKSLKLIHGTMENSTHHIHQQDMNDVTRVVMAVIIIFSVTNFPWFFLGVLQICSHFITPNPIKVLRKDYKCFWKISLAIFTLMNLANSSINFFIYFFLRKSFRASFKEMLCMRKLQRRSVSSDRSTGMTLNTFNDPTGQINTSMMEWKETE